MRERETSNPLIPMVSRVDLDAVIVAAHSRTDIIRKPPEEPGIDWIIEKSFARIPNPALFILGARIMRFRLNLLNEKGYPFPPVEM